VVAQSGLGAAAWAMLTWTHALFETPVPSLAWRTLAPGQKRARYLRAWLERDPAALYQRWPLLVRGGFSLALHKSPWAALRALMLLPYG
jgi:hypothetical protein